MCLKMLHSYGCPRHHTRTLERLTHKGLCASHTPVHTPPMFQLYYHTNVYTGRGEDVNASAILIFTIPTFFLASRLSTDDPIFCI